MDSEEPALLRKLSAIPPLALPGATVHVVSRNKADSIADRLLNLLDGDDRARLTRIAAPDLCRRFVVGRAAIRTILSALQPGRIPETDWRFGTSVNGKPYVRPIRGLVPSFNLSYAEDLVAIAVSRELEVGVDIERDREVPRSDLPLHLFAAAEQRLLEASPAADLTGVFLRLWTLKEAIAKRTGQGFAAEFPQIDTTKMTVVDGPETLGRRRKAGDLLFHTALSGDAGRVFLSVSTAPTR